MALQSSDLALSHTKYYILYFKFISILFRLDDKQSWHMTSYIWNRAMYWYDTNYRTDGNTTMSQIQRTNDNAILNSWRYWEILSTMNVTHTDNTESQRSNVDSVKNFKRWVNIILFVIIIAERYVLLLLIYFLNLFQVRQSYALLPVLMSDKCLASYT